MEGAVWAHNSILDVWSECLSDFHIPHQKEPRHQYTNSDNHPDITLFDSETGQNLDVDVSLAHPWSQDIRKEQVEKMDMPQEQEKRRR